MNNVSIKKAKSKNLKDVRQLGIIIVLVLMAVIFAIGSDKFFTSSNMVSILQQTAIKGTLALGMTVVIITGGIDLSVGSTIALTSTIAATMMVSGGETSIPVALLSAVGVGLLCGLGNGLLISLLDLQPFLVTMGTLSLFQGINYIYGQAMTIRGLPQLFYDAMNSLNDFIPVAVLIMIAAVAVLIFVTKCTKFGRYIFAVGGNEEATRLSGVNVKLVRVLVYTILGGICGVCAILFLGRVGSTDANTASGYELEAIAASAIGGASLAGGKGNFIGTILGALMLALLANGLTLLRVQAFYQVLATGIIIIAAVVLDRFSNK